MPRRCHRLCIVVAAGLAAAGHASAQSTPSLTAVHGTVGANQPITITGAGFGHKEHAAPLLWAPFDDGLAPSTLGRVADWDRIQNMEWSADDGGTAKGINAARGVWTLRVDYDAWTADGQRFYIYRKEKKNFQITSATQNWKNWRMWPAGGTGNYPNIYSAENNGIIWVEGTAGGYYSSGLRVETTDWVTQEFIVQASTIDNWDGFIQINYDGQVMTSGTILTRTTDRSDVMTQNYVVHGVNANVANWNPGWSEDNIQWNDDVYVDTTWARVMVGDADTWDASRLKQIQIPTAWSDDEITFSAVEWDWNGPAWLYVVNEDGHVNPQGYLIPEPGSLSLLGLGGLGLLRRSSRRA